MKNTRNPKYVKEIIPFSSESEADPISSVNIKVDSNQFFIRITNILYITASLARSIA